MMKNDLKRNENNSTILFSFSGTGNSLNVALKIQDNIENCKILPISKVVTEKHFEFEATKIGFVFPVYFLDIPHIVREFLEEIKILGNPYIFAIATCGGEVGNAFKNINKILAKQNRKLNSEFKMIFPSNSIVLMNKSETPEEISQRIKNSEGRIEEISSIITHNKNAGFTTTKASIFNRFVSWMGKFFLFRMLNDRTFKVDEDICTKCGTCVSVCPMNNIEIIDGKVTWKHNCECCVACLHWCPQRAIENIGTHDAPRYHHPHITIKQMKSHK